MCFQGINIRNNEVVSRGFEIKIKGEENERNTAGKTLIDAVIEENGLKWNSTRQLGINTDIAGDGFDELFKSEDPKEQAKPSKGWKIVLLDPETIDFQRDRNQKILIDKNPLSPRYGYPIGYDFIEDPDTDFRRVPIAAGRIIHLIYNQIGGEMIGTSTLQPIYGTSERVMNVDQGYAESAYRVGYPQRTIGVGNGTDFATDQQMTDAEELAKDLATKDIITYDRSSYKIETLQTQTIDPSISLNYFQNSKMVVFGIPKYQLMGSSAGEGNRAIAETMAKDRASMTHTMQLAVKNCYESQIFRRILDAERLPDVTIEMVWNPIIEEDKDSEIDNILKLKNGGIITPLEARNLLSDFIDIAKDDVSGLPLPQQPGFNPFQSSFKAVTAQLQKLTEADKAQRNKIVNMDFNKVGEIRAEFANSLNKFYEQMRHRLSSLFEQNKTIIEENIAIDGIKQVITEHLGRTYNLGYSQGSQKVKTRKLRILKVSNDIASIVSAYATTIALKESSDLVNAVNIQISLGLSAGESIPEIKKRIGIAFEKFGGTTGRFADIGTRAELIARTETQKIVNSARLDAYKDAAIEKYEWLALITDEIDADCLALNGRIFNVNEGPLPVSSTHPNCRCLIDGQIPVYTIDGWKPISKINIGEMVLTHQGRFRKVTQIFHTPQQIKEVTRIITGVRQTEKLTITDEHPILINGQWKNASKIKIGDEVNYLANYCKRCQKLIPFYNTYCSFSCNSKDVTARQWAKDEHRKIVSTKNRLSMLNQYKSKIRDKNSITKQANIKTRELVKQGKHILQNPEIHIQAHKSLGSKNYGKSFLEERLGWALTQRGIKFESQYTIEKGTDNLGKLHYYFIDFAIPEHKIAIECDGDYWHKNTEKDIIRQQHIENQGWQFLRFKETDIRTNIFSCVYNVERLMANHNSEFKFISRIIKKIERWTLKKKRTLYNLAVEEDESYIANGFITHNCTIIPII